VVAIERAGELAALLALLEREGRAVHRLAPSPAARPPTPGEEEAYREGRLRAHLYDASVRLFGAGRLVLDWAAGPWSGNGSDGAAGNGHGPGGTGNGHAPGVAAGTVVGLLDGGGFCLGLGRVQAVHDDRVAVATRVTRRDVAGLRVGDFRVAEDGSPL